MGAVLDRRQIADMDRAGAVGAGDALTLARSVLGTAALTPELEAQVTERAEATPWWRSCYESYAMPAIWRSRDGALGLVQGATARIPATLTEVLLARLESVEPLGAVDGAGS